MVRLLSLLVLLTGLVSYAVAKSKYVPNKYIVEFDPSVAANDFQSTLDSFYKHLRDNAQLDLTHSFDYTDPRVLVGAAFHAVPSAAHPDYAFLMGTSSSPHSNDKFRSQLVMKAVKQSPHAVHVWKDVYIPHLSNHQASDTDVPLGRMKRARRGARDFAQETLDVAERASIDHPDTYGPHVQMGIEIQHKRGNRGNGITLCATDLTPDYSNAALNGGRGQGVPCIGDGCPLIGGIDYIGQDYDGINFNPGPLNYTRLDEETDCSHGTHVSSIMLGNSTFFTGVAPEARWRHYATFPCTRSDNNTQPGSIQDSQSSILIKAFSQGLSDGCDLMSGSFGSAANWCEETPLPKIYAALAEEGMTVILSAGNSGDYGQFTSNEPGCGEGIITVASAQNKVRPAQPLVLSPPLPDGRDTLPVLLDIPAKLNNSNFASKPFWFSPALLNRRPGQTGPDVSDFCKELPADTPDLSGYYVVILRGASDESADCTLAIKFQNAADKGATDVFAMHDNVKPVYYYAPDDIHPSFRGIISFNDGNALIDAYKKNPEIKGHFSPRDRPDWYYVPNVGDDVFDDKTAAPRLSYFSTQYPTYDGRLKPETTAVGGTILGAFAGKYQIGVLEGTSMSCPQVSGSVGLMKAALPGIKTYDIRRRISHTGSPIPFDKNNPNTQPESLYVQGGGMINITAAIELETNLEPIKFDLKTTAQYHDKLTRTLKVRNDGHVSHTYHLSHEPVTSKFALQEGAPNNRKNLSQTLFEGYPVPNHLDATVTFHPRTLTVAPGHVKEVQVHFNPPPPSLRLNVFSGYIRVKSDHPHGDARVPYGGIAGHFDYTPAFETGISPFNVTMPAMFTVDLAEEVRNDTSVWTLNPEDINGFFVVAYVLQAPTERLIIDVVHADTAYKASVAIDDVSDLNSNSTLPQFADDIAAELGEEDDNDIGGETLISPARRAKKKHHPSQRKNKVHHNSGYLRLGDVPIVGRINDDDYRGQDVLSFRTFDDAFSTAYPSDVLTNPETKKDFKLKPGKYRILIRAHRWSRDGFNPEDDLESNYDSYLSHVWTYDPNANHGKKEETKEGENAASKRTFFAKQGKADFGRNGEL